MLTVGRYLRIDGDDEVCESGARDACDHRRDLVDIARKICLEPSVRMFPCEILEPDERRARHDHWDVRFTRGGGQYQIAAICRQRADAHRRDAERRCEFTTEE